MTDSRPIPIPSGPRQVPPTTSEAGRRLLHALMAMLGWIAFAWYWSLVFYRTPPAEAVRGVLVLGLLLLLAVAATLAWIRHNIRLFRNASRRRRPPFVRADFSRDALGRMVVAPAWEDVRLAPEVEITVTDPAPGRGPGPGSVPAPGPGPGTGSEPGPGSRPGPGFAPAPAPAPEASVKIYRIF